MRILLLVCFLTVSFSPTAIASSKPADGQKAETSKGLTLEDIAQGLKSAAKNIGDEIPKIGPAIGETFNKATGKEKPSEKSPTKRAPKEKQ